MRIDLDDLQRAKPENVRRLAKALGLGGWAFWELRRVRREVQLRLDRTQPPPPKSDPRFWFL